MLCAHHYRCSVPSCWQSDRWSWLALQPRLHWQVNKRPKVNLYVIGMPILITCGNCSSERVTMLWNYVITDLDSFTQLPPPFHSFSLQLFLLMKYVKTKLWRVWLSIILFSKTVVSYKVFLNNQTYYFKIYTNPVESRTIHYKLDMHRCHRVSIFMYNRLNILHTSWHSRG